MQWWPSHLAVQHGERLAARQSQGDGERRAERAVPSAAEETSHSEVVGRHCRGGASTGPGAIVFVDLCEMV